ncbi:MAG TPA: SUMF1/EgtB/PvdO family nonheme iron enzyme [Pseudomonadales bacterium]|nr:SUMF1/EgtB/PvdO family nonheme iron enzyme [Pseudomonadales bacterium]
MTAVRIAALAGVVLTLVAAALAWDAWRIEVRLDSEPTGARVHLDGRLIGETPLTLSPAPGRHRVELTHGWHLPAVLTLEVARGDRLERTVSLDPGTGELSLLSNPRGAWVELNGTRLQGETPMVVTAASGPTTVRMGLEERRVEEKDVIVLADQTIEVNLDLDIDPHGALLVAVTPADAVVRFADLDVAYAPGVRVPVGEHLIDISRRGYEPRRISFFVRQGENRTAVTLTRGRGALTVRTEPRDALVTVTRRDEGGVETTVPWTPGMRLPTGPLEIRARAIGHRTAYRALELGGDGASVDLRLEKMRVTPGSTFTDTLADGGTGPRMIVIPGGTFLMGDPDGAPSVRPARERTLAQPFAVSVHEVTMSEFRRFVDATGHSADSRIVASLEPVRYVTWEEAVAYGDWLTRQTGSRYRLPTEAEWEYMARAGTRTAYAFGDDPSELCAYANLADASTHDRYRDWDTAACDDGFVTIAPVGSFPPNAFGVHDVHGNVAEWVLECGMPPYAGAPDDGTRVSLGQSCSLHGVRGGSWDDPPGSLRIERRGIASGAGDDRGIRLVREL